MLRLNCFHFEHRQISPAFFAHSAMQGFFVRVDLAEYRQQQLIIAEQLKEHPPPRAITPPPKRSVGRPKLKRAAEDVLAASAAAQDVAATQENKRMRGQYTRWFNSPYINDILHAHVQCAGSARGTVQNLQKHAPDDRYARLSHSTVASWFDKDGKLLAKHQQELDAGQAMPTYSGASPLMQATPGAEDEISDILLKLRSAGTPLNSLIIRWVMQAVVEKKCPALLQQLTLSQSFISRWVRSNPRLQFRWRARTTAASKLPDDWEDQGVRMAQRMGAIMQLHKVRNTLGIRPAAVFLPYFSRIPDVILA
jgi:hypothetical protein